MKMRYKKRRRTVCIHVHRVGFCVECKKGKEKKSSRTTNTMTTANVMKINRFVLTDNDKKQSKKNYTRKNTCYKKNTFHIHVGFYEINLCMGSFVKQTDFFVSIFFLIFFFQMHISRGGYFKLLLTKFAKWMKETKEKCA